jgi:hypothetical protein
MPRYKYKGKSKYNRKAYQAWYKMIQRCYNSSEEAYKNYGGRGIVVCKRWHNFLNFLNDMGCPSDRSLSLDRKNNNKGYSKSNCCWSTISVQNRNKRTVRIFWVDGKPMSLPEVSKKYCVNYHTLYWRMKENWPLDKMISPAGRFDL